MARSTGRGCAAGGSTGVVGDSVRPEKMKAIGSVTIDSPQSFREAKLLQTLAEGGE